ncbi:MAG TPA: hypothetical protein VK205_14605 [Prolixibacteraceae bacterium]|nr:hypothetical protein [Prolixibacteraceae bacterium]
MQLTKAGKYQNKLLMMMLGSVILLFLAWNMAIKKTIVAFKNVRELNNNITSIEQKSLHKNQLLDQIGQLNNVLGIGENKIQTESIFEELVNICKAIDNVRIVNFPDIHQMEANGYKITTIFASFEGSYADLLTLVYQLERNKKIGRLVSVDFKKSKDLKKGSEFLNLTILLQNYELTDKH